MKKVLILYATAGIGHKKAALAVKAALDEIPHEGVDVQIADSLDYTNSFFKWFYLESYLRLVNKHPLLWGRLYHLTDNSLVNMVVSKFRRLNNWLNSFKLCAYLIKDQPDVIISTHFFGSEVISRLKQKAKIRSRLITIVTDYRLHSWWVAPKTDTYIVADDLAKDDLLKWKVPGDRIKVLGIPAEPVFSKSLGKDVLRAKNGIDKDVFTVLVIGGGFGVGPIVDIVKMVDSVSSGINIIVICGHNEALVKQIEDMKTLFNNKVIAMGFVNTVYEYMEIADILISKSGGITVTESLAKNLPLIVISPIIGQETRNCDFLLQSGAAVMARKVSDIGPIFKDLAANPQKVEEMRRAIEKIRKPMACYDIAKLALEMCGNG